MPGGGDGSPAGETGVFLTLNQNNKRGLYIYLAVLMAVVFVVMSWVNANAAKKGVEYNRIVADFL